jgi:polyhydroxybutyrate depolymerase
VVAYPDAIAAQWNDGWWNSTSDDVGFLGALADALVNEFGIDRRRVYVAGFSNGACMAHRLACETDRFAAIAAVSGDMFTSAALRCSEPGETLQLPDVDPNDGTRVSVQAHARCRAGTEVALYTITGGGHTWPGEDFQWLRFRRPGNIAGTSMPARPSWTSS